MSKVKLGIIVIVVAAISSVGTVAAARYLPWTVNIYSVSSTEEADNGTRASTVSTFDDRGNKCYILTNSGYSDDARSISCVRMK